VTPLSVLFVDDDPMQVELLGRALAYEEVEVRGVPSLSEVGIALAEGRVDFVLLDASVLGADPRSSVMVVRALSGGPTKILLLSAADEGKLRRMAIECGVDGWLSKSLPVPDMAKHLRSMAEKAT
jgi:DNA-binding response OmpR family regulator